MADEEATGVTVGPLQGSQRLIWFGGSIAGTQQERLHLPSPPYSPTDARVGEIVLTVQLLLNGWEEREFRGPTKRAEAARFAQRYYGEWLQDGRARQLATPPPSIRARKAHLHA